MKEDISPHKLQILYKVQHSMFRTLQHNFSQDQSYLMGTELYKFLHGDISPVHKKDKDLWYSRKLNKRNLYNFSYKFYHHHICSNPQDTLEYICYRFLKRNSIEGILKGILHYG